MLTLLLNLTVQYTKVICKREKVCREGKVSCGGRRKGERKGESYYYLNQVSTKISLGAILKTVHPKCSQVIKKFLFFLIMNFYKELQKKNVSWFPSL